MQNSNKERKKQHGRSSIQLMTLSIALSVILVSSALSVGPFFVQSAWALPYVSSVSVSPSSTEKTKGETATYTVTVSRSSGSGSGTINLSFQSSTIPSSAVTFGSTSVTFGNGGSNSKSTSLTISTNDLSIDTHTFTVKGTKSNAASDSATSSSTTLKVIKPPNQPPTANAGDDQTVNEADSVSLDGSGSSDPDGTIESYSWTQTAGTGVTLDDASSATPSFTAPDVSADGDTLTFELTVTDNDGATATDSVNVNVNNVVVNQPPTANAGDDQTVNEGDQVSLDGSGSSDPDGDTLTYAWTQTAGTGVTLDDASSATPSFTAPNVDSAGDTLTFELTVDDGNGHTATDTVNIAVENANQPPTANAGADFSVNEGTTGVQLQGSGQDADGTISSYQWEQVVSGSEPTVTINDANSATATFDAPSVSANTELTFKLTVTDNDGATAEDSVVVTINNVNQNPIADAGTDQTVNEGDSVSLDGSASSDADGTIASYSWTQTAGTAVTLSDASSATPSFTAPNVGSNGDALAFELTVTDNDGATSTADSVSVTVNNVNQPPTANAGADFSVNEGTTGVQLQGSGQDADGTISSYQWEQTDGPSVILNNADTATATFDAPSVSANTWLTFKLTVTDNDGATAEDSVVVTINNVNQPPIASLTVNPTTIQEGSTSTLDASASTDDAGIVQYIFEQVGGTAGTITVDSADPSKATFQAPSISADETATIQVTVKDAEDATDSATAEIVVTNAPPHATTLTLNTITSVPWGKDITVTGKLTDNAASGAGVSGATISFDGTGADNLPDNVVTNSDGTFTAKAASPTTVATGWKVQAHFVGNPDFTASNSLIKTYSTTKHSVFIAITFKGSTGSASSTPWSMPTAFTATLTDASTGGTVIQGKTIHFDGTGVIGVADQTTGTDGKAIGTGTAPNTVATGWTYQAHFAGDSLYNKKDSAIKTYTTTKHSVGLSLSLPTTPIAPGASYKVSGTLTDTTAKVPLASKTITFTADAPITITDKITNTNGFYSATQAAPSTPGTYNIQSHFAGDSLYNAKDSVTKTLTVS